MIILGYCAYVFDSSACLIIDGKLVAACQEERFTREKNTGAFPAHSIRYCLEKANITIEDVDHVTFYWKPFTGLSRRIWQIIKGLPKSLNFWGSHSDKWSSMVFTEKELKKNFPGKHKFRFHNIRHHYAHAASTFLISPFKEANLLVMDGSGEIECTSMGYGKNLDIDLRYKINFPHSLGYLYVAITHYLGFKPDSDEYKVMAMASMGKETSYYDRFKEIIQLKENGRYEFDLSYFDYQKGNRDPWVSQKFIEVFGPLRKRSTTQVNRTKLEERHFDIAWALQRRLEDVALHMATFLHNQNPCENLLISGGTGLNCVMNEKIRKKGPYKNVWTFSAPHDAGTSIGSAFYLYNSLLKNKRTFTYDHAYWGPSFEDHEIESVLRSSNYQFKKLSEEDLIKSACQDLTEGKIIGWFQGGTEFGPRALGNRSILADPRSEKMKDAINSRIKHRERFRPFAPAILSEHAEEWFDISRDLPFMTFVVKARDEKASQIAAVVHHDQTVRVQTVHKETNFLFHELISEFKNQTGVPILLNTSFNDNGEPIVNSPEDAISSFGRTNLDGLYIGHYHIKKAK